MLPVTVTEAVGPGRAMLLATRREGDGEMPSPSPRQVLVCGPVQACNALDTVVDGILGQ